MSKLTPKKIEQIIKMLAQGSPSREIARATGATRYAINQVKNGEHRVRAVCTAPAGSFIGFSEDSAPRRCPKGCGMMQGTKDRPCWPCHVREQLRRHETVSILDTVGGR